MKVNFFLSFLGLALALLVGYWAFNVAEGKENDVICGVGSTICFLVTLIPALGMNYESSKLGTNVKVLSFLFFIIFLISHFCFAVFGVKMPFYILCNGIILIIYLAIVYKLSGVKDI